jgi:type I restriction enzyme, R subunit
MPEVASSANFAFLSSHDAQLVRLGALSERYFKEDPNTCLIKLRQFGELLAQVIAAKTGLYENQNEAQSDLLRRLKFERITPREVGELFHHLRVIGNKATHGSDGDHGEALTGIKIARELGIWFHRTFGKDKNFSPGPFVPPSDPVDATKELSDELERLRQKLDETRSEAERSRFAAEEHAKARLNAEETARKEAEDRVIWEHLAQEAEAAKNNLAGQLSALQATAKPRAIPAIIELAEESAKVIDLDEAATREIIDQQLRDRGWEADTVTLRYSEGVRPIKGRNMAIAEWPTASGPADYAFFIGTECVATAEAKRKRKNVSAAIDQAERYAKGIKVGKGINFPGGPWSEFIVPFTFSSNGRPYLKQIETESGVWFRDVRKATNQRRALNDWLTPEGLRGMLEIDREAAHARLKTMPKEFGFPLRPYQKRAIEAVEKELETDQRTMLLAMATGTGKTKLAIALLYRLLESKRFRRICFVVDRSALGEQAAGEFKTTRIVSVRTFADIFGLKELRDTTPETETRVHICTIQGLVKRVLYADGPSSVPPVDQYDLLVVDECHRGYLLDREMSDAELEFRSQDDYVSKYRRVLEHFDAVKIGLTATPALHTVDIFGKPIFTYSYREAVVDDFLIDHEPPIQIGTKRSREGITFQKGEEIEVFDTASGEVDLARTPDEVKFEVEDFNKRVITVPFNTAVAQTLAEYIDPNLPGKTLIFAATDAHADIVVEEVKKAFAERYGEIEDGAVKKITGSVDRVGQLIKSFRNDSFPKIAVTVDLLTTGIDVPSIMNLVFLRRVNSRILYEQMLGRATRRCDEIEKETFRIFDAVDLYPHLQKLTAMKPVVVNPSITFEQLLEEFARVEEERHREILRDQIIVQLRRRVKKMPQRAKDSYSAQSGETPEATIERLKTGVLSEVANWFKEKPGLGKILDWDPQGRSGLRLPISHHEDEVESITRGYGEAERPEDFIESFVEYVRSNVNKIAALTLVVQRPRELTRAQLRELRLELDRKGFSEVSLRQAWQDTKNEDIAASIIGFVRQAAIGDPLVPYDERVKAGMRRILAKKQWSEPQRKWLKRIEEQILREVIVDRETLGQGIFEANGGFERLNKVFSGELENLLGDIQDEVWRKVS